MKVARSKDIGEVRLVFFGLNRSAQFTHKSIEENILRPIKEAGFRVSAFGAFMNIQGMVVNERSGEVGLKIHNDFSKYISLEKEVYIDQEKFDRDMDFPSVFLGCNDPWGDGYRSLRNLFRYMYSLKTSYEMAKIGENEPAFFIFLRPDMYYHNRIDVSNICVGDSDAFLPTWGKFGGENDRFCIAGARAAEIYGKRFDAATNFMHKSRAIHSEEYLKYVLASGGIRIKITHMYATRIRADGVRSKEDFGRIHAVSELGILEKLIIWFGIKKFNFFTPFKK